MHRHEYVVQGNLDLMRGNMVRIEDGRGTMVRVVIPGYVAAVEG